MSRVIKNNDGVAVVEGTPAASLVKDVDKFFAAKPPERMAGESIAPVRRDRMLTGKFKDKDGNEIPFEYSPTWYHYPIIIGDKKYDLDPSITIASGL